jgi:hypothetical protein
MYVGIDEFSSNDPRYKRKTFAIRIGYNGSKYNGYQRQKGTYETVYFLMFMDGSIQIYLHIKMNL